MAGREHLNGAPGLSLPIFERLAPPPPPAIVKSRIEALTTGNNVVIDPFGRGGWVARAALDRGRQAVSFETAPLSRLLAEVVLRPPDLRHLDAAFQAIASAPHGQTTLRAALNDLFATQCLSCGRTVVLDDLVWEAPRSAGRRRSPERPTDPAAARRGHAARRHYRCTICRDQLGGPELRQVDADEADRARAAEVEPESRAWRLLHDRFPVPPGHDDLVEELLALHTPRQLVSLHAILERIDAELRAPAVEAALRLALLQAIVPATRLATAPGKVARLRITGGHVRLPAAATWRERNPWLAFEEGMRLVRGFVQRLDSGATGVVQARFRDDLRGLAEQPDSVLVRVATPAVISIIAEAAAKQPGALVGLRPRLILGQAPPLPSPERLALGFFGTGWVLGQAAASTLDLEPLLGAPAGAWWGWQAARIEAQLAAIAPLATRDARAVLLLDEGGSAGLVATALGAVGAGHRLAAASLDAPDEGGGGLLELVPPGSHGPDAPRTRANVALPPLPGGAGDPDYVRGRGIFAPPERIDARPYSPEEAAAAVVDIAVDTLQARGEPADEERLLGEILVGLDRGGHLRRFVRDLPAAGTSDRWSGPIETLTALIRDALADPDRRRLEEVAPGTWWLASADDRAAAALPLADRVEWAVFSLLSTGGPITQSALVERIVAMFPGHDQPDEPLILACLESYRGAAATAVRVATDEELNRRSSEQSELLALLVELGHRLGMRVWLGPREQARVLRGKPLGDLLDDHEREGNLTGLARASEVDLEQVACIWYLRGRLTFLFEVDWTAMLGETILRRHARIAPDDRLVRFLVVAPERAELIRAKVARSVLVRRALERDNWHLLKWNHVRAFANLDWPTLDDLEPYLGLDAPIESGRLQMPMFAESPAT